MAESIGAENKGGVRIGISHKIIRVDLIRCSYTLEQYVSLWMGLCLFPGQMSQIHLVLHIGLILRQLIDGIGNHVSSRVADVHDVIFVIHNQKSYDCCTHACSYSGCILCQFLVLPHYQVVPLYTKFIHWKFRCFQQSGKFIDKPLIELPDHCRTGQLTISQTAHSVTHDAQTNLSMVCLRDFHEY